MSDAVPPLPPIHTELAWSDHAAALGIVAKGNAPLLQLCRQLIDAGHDPATPLEAWRGGVLCLRIRSIGEAARLEINGRGNGFVRPKSVGRASLVRADGLDDRSMQSDPPSSIA